MSQENVTPLERLYRAWGDRDMDTVVAVCAPEVMFWTSGAFPGVKPLYEGRSGIRAFWDEFDVWQSLAIIPERVVESEGQVVALWRFEAVGRDGISVTRHGGHAAQVEAGLITEIRAYSDWTAALEAVGLSE